MTALLDANILISYLLATSPSSPVVRVVEAAFDGAYTLLLPPDVVDEFGAKVVQKDYLARGISAHDAADFIETLALLAIVPVRIETFVSVVRDAKDDYLIAYALYGQADYLVTGDKGLWAEHDLEGLAVVSPAEFVRLLEAPLP
jgi:uncharacterized protein